MGEFDLLARKCARVHSVHVPRQRCARAPTPGKCFGDCLYTLNPILEEKSWIFLDKNNSFELRKFSRVYK